MQKFESKMNALSKSWETSDTMYEERRIKVISLSKVVMATGKHNTFDIEIITHS